MKPSLLPGDAAEIKRSIEILQPLDLTAATKVLKEAGQIFRELGVTFFLRKGTCLGAIRDNGLIPWDDDLDIGSVIGLHGLTEKLVDRTVISFRNNGFITNVARQNDGIYVVLLKTSVRIDWACHLIIGDSTFHWPGVRIPAGLFTHLKEIDFLGERFKVPNPAVEYLRFMYGADWKVPKKAGNYEKDVLGQITEDPAFSRPGKLKQFVIKYLLPWLATRIKVFDLKGRPVTGAEVVVAGLGHFTTNSQGYAKLHILENNIYSLIIRYGNHEEVLYEENILQGKTYFYRPDAQSTSGRYFTLIPQRDSTNRI